MVRVKIIRRTFGLASSAARSYPLVALLMGLSLSLWGCMGGPSKDGPCKDGREFPSYANSATLAVATTNALAMVRQKTQDSAANIENVMVAKPADGDSDRELRIKKRLLTVALVGGVLLLLLAFAYGYLRLELTTRGFYSGRLQIASGIASLSTMAAAYFLWRWLVY